jgi:hypothetical protein
MTGIEPALSAWEAEVLPLNYIRRGLIVRRTARPSLARMQRTGWRRRFMRARPLQPRDRGGEPRLDEDRAERIESQGIRPLPSRDRAARRQPQSVLAAFLIKHRFCGSPSAKVFFAQVLAETVELSDDLVLGPFEIREVLRAVDDVPSLKSGVGEAQFMNDTSAEGLARTRGPRIRELDDAQSPSAPAGQGGAAIDKILTSHQLATKHVIGRGECESERLNGGEVDHGSRERRDCQGTNSRDIPAGKSPAVPTDSALGSPARRSIRRDMNITRPWPDDRQPVDRRGRPMGEDGSGVSRGDGEHPPTMAIAGRGGVPGGPRAVRSALQPDEFAPLDGSGRRACRDVSLQQICRQKKTGGPLLHPPIVTRSPSPRRAPARRACWALRRPLLVRSGERVRNGQNTPAVAPALVHYIRATGGGGRNGRVERQTGAR